jgi:hypothetical protein
MNNTAKVLPPVDADNHDVDAVVEAALHCAGFAVFTAIDGTKVAVARPDSIVDLDPPTPTPPVPWQKKEVFA